MEHLVIPQSHRLLGILGYEVVEQFFVMSHTKSVVGHVDHSAPSIVGTVAGEHSRNAQPSFLANLLHGIDQIKLIFRRTRQSRNECAYSHHLCLIARRGICRFPYYNGNFILGGCHAGMLRGNNRTGISSGVGIYSSGKIRGYATIIAGNTIKAQYTRLFP